MTASFGSKLSRGSQAFDTRAYCVLYPVADLCKDNFPACLANNSGGRGCGVYADTGVSAIRSQVFECLREHVHAARKQDDRRSVRLSTIEAFTFIMTHHYVYIERHLNLRRLLSHT